LLHVNPIRVWATFRTPALLAGEAPPPAPVAFFPSGGEVATAVFEPAGQERLCELAHFAPCSLDEWSMLAAREDRDDLAAFVRELIGMGLAAVG
jgi:hypothetical protein